MAQQGDVRELADLIAGITREFVRPRAGGDIPGEATQTITSVGDYMNPFMNKTNDEIAAEFIRLGLDQYMYLLTQDRGRAIQKLNILKEMDEYAYAMINFRDENKPYYVDEGFQRKAFDVFVNTYKSSSKGVPLEQTYKYIPQSIPEAKVKFDGKHYVLTQDGTKMTMKNFRDIERIALKGGDYSAELTALRDIKRAIEKRETPMNIVFKSRKI